MEVEDLDDQVKYIFKNYAVDGTRELGPEHLRYIRAAMIKVAAKWRNVGLSLGVDPDKMDTFSDRYKDDCYRCLTAVINDWLIGRSAKHTWRDVVIAVGSRSGGENPAEAERLAKEKFSTTLAGVPESAGVDTKTLEPETATIAAVNRALVPVEAKWEEVGVFLGLPYFSLMAGHYKKDKMLYIATEYLNKNYAHELHGKPTWKHVVEAIGSRAGADNPKYAEEIALKHQATRIVEDTDSNVQSESWTCEPGGISACINRNPGARGLAVVVTNDYMNTADALPGTREDAKSLLETFLFAKFIVCCKYRATGDELLQLIEEVRSLEAEQVKNYECILFAFSGHGDEDDWICMEDDAQIDVLEQVLAPLLPGSAQELGTIPKVILWDACRGENETGTIRVPVIKKKSTSTQRQQRRVASNGNYLIACATLPEHYAYMSPNNLGSAWIQILAAELRTSKKEIQNVLTNVNTKLEERARDKIEFQQPITYSTLNREVYIHPDHSTQQ